MYNSLVELFKKHLKDSFFIYIIVVFCFLIGISVGAFTIKVLDIYQKQELISYLKGFFRVLDETGLRSSEIFLESISNNMQLLLLSWFMGLIVIGIPIVLLVISFKGFVIGFTVGLIIDEFKLNGFLLFILGIFPQNLIIVPAFVIATATSIIYCGTVIRGKLKRNASFKLSKVVAIYSMVYLGILMALVIGSFVESFIVPFFIKIIAGRIGV